MARLAILALLVSGAGSVFAAEASRPLAERLVACAGIDAAAGRLACFDREVAPLTQASEVPRQPAPAAPAVQAPVAAADPAPPALGQEQLPRSVAPPAAAASEALHARITELRNLGSGFYLVLLDNGQAWRHDNEALGAYLRQGESITISKGNLGTYRLVRDAGKARDWIRVARVR